MEVGESFTSSLEINPKLDVQRSARIYASRRHIRIENIFTGPSAAALYRHISRIVRWRTFVVSNGRLSATPKGEHLTADEDLEIIRTAQGAAREAFSCVYDADREFPEDLAHNLNERQIEKIVAEKGPLDQLLGSEALMPIVASVTQLTGIAVLRTQVTRLRPGQFVGFQSWSASSENRHRRLDIVLNMTPAWRPEWGGILEFRSDDADTIIGYPPTFNALDIFEFPLSHWISAVAPYAPCARLVLVGRIYVG